MSKSVLGHLQLLLSADSAQITNDLGKAEAAVKRSTRQMETQAGGAMKAVTAEVGKMGPALKGAQQSTTAALQALTVFGSKGSAAVGGISNALAGLLSGGFTPLGLAIGVATTAVGYFVAKQGEVKSSTDEASKSIEKQRDRFKELADEAQRLADTGAAKAGRTSVDVVQLQRQYDALIEGRRVFEEEMRPVGSNASQEERIRVIRLQAEFQKTLAEMDRKISEAETLLLAAKANEFNRAQLAGEIQQAVKKIERLTADGIKRLQDAQEMGGDNPYRGPVTLNSYEQALSDAADKRRREEAAARDRKAFEDGEAAFIFGAQLREMENAQRAANGEAVEYAKAIKKAAEVSRVSTGDGFAGGFGGTIAELADLQRAGEEAGRGIAFALTDGVGGALADVARGAATTGEAFRRLGLDVANMIARMGLQLALSQAFGAGFGIASPAGGLFSTPQAGVPMANGGAHAHGGTFRVGGFGGLDSQLVAMRLSPGEMVKVTDGANSGRGGGGESPVNVALSIRPPAVIADDVLAKSSREAKAAVVSSAVSRGGRRGQRARD